MEHSRLLVCVESAEPLHERRALCRYGWIQRFARRVPDMQVFFVTGNSKDGARRDGDVVRLPARDEYDWLPEKTRELFRYALERYDFEFLFKCDDDTFVHLERLYRRLNPAEEYAGEVARWTGGDHSYYCWGGAGYLLTRASVEAALSHMKMPDPMHGAEDVVVGLALKSAGIFPSPDSRFSQFAKVVPSTDNDQISCHYVRTQEQVDSILIAL